MLGCAPVSRISSLMQGLHIAVQAMAAAGAERVGLGQAGSNNLVELTGSSEENKGRLSSFLNNMMERGQHTVYALPVQSRRQSKLLLIPPPGLAS